MASISDPMRELCKRCWKIGRGFGRGLGRGSAGIRAGICPGIDIRDRFRARNLSPGYISTFPGYISRSRDTFPGYISGSPGYISNNRETLHRNFGIHFEVPGIHFRDTFRTPSLQRDTFRALRDTFRRSKHGSGMHFAYSLDPKP